MLLRVLRPNLILVHSVPLCVDPLIRPLEHNRADQSDRRENKTNAEAGGVAFVLFGVQEHVRAEDPAAVAKTDVQSNAHGALGVAG